MTKRRRSAGGASSNTNSDNRHYLPPPRRLPLEEAAELLVELLEEAAEALLPLPPQPLAQAQAPVPVPVLVLRAEALVVEPAVEVPLRPASLLRLAAARRQLLDQCRASEASMPSTCHSMTRHDRSLHSTSRALPTLSNSYVLHSSCPCRVSVRIKPLIPGDCNLENQRCQGSSSRCQGIDGYGCHPVVVDLHH